VNARFLGGCLGLAVLLGSSAASAQQVVVLEFQNDKSAKLRRQVEKALQESGSLTVVSLRDYKAAAAKKRLKGARAMTPRSVALTAKALGLDGAVGGSVGKSLRLQILDPSGAVLSASRFSLHRGLLSSRDARRFAETVAHTLALQKIEPPPVPKAEPAPPPPKSESETEKENRVREELAEAHTVNEVKPPPPPASPAAVLQAKRPRIGPRVVNAQITGTTTWRSYCSRPGFSSCAQYNAVDPTQRPPGDTVDFKAQIPYMGFSLAAELFPFAELDSLFRGLGLLASYERGYSQTNVNVLTTAGDLTTRQVYAADSAITALLAFRYFFSLGREEPLLGHAGIHGGFGTRRFDVDANALSAAVRLPGSHRNYPVVGLDVSIPIFKFLRVEGTGNYFINPKPFASEVASYGATASATGWGGELGLTGDVWGPLGYLVRFRYERYKDQFSGSGSSWQSGGAAEESYAGIFWGVTAHF